MIQRLEDAKNELYDNCSHEEYVRIQNKINHICYFELMNLMGDDTWYLFSFNQIYATTIDKKRCYKIISFLEDCGYNINDLEKHDLIETYIVSNMFQLIFSSEDNLIEFLEKYPIELKISDHFQVKIENRKNQLAKLIERTK